MHSYFATVEPTQTNKYTGIFEGKNLIFITAESFYPYFISEELTPALYEISQHGFVFSEYYQPNWGGTTTTGEFTNLFGLIPASISAMQNYAPKYTPFLIGQQLLDLGYTSIAFHNYTSTYYSRDKTHTQLGYSLFLTPDNGLSDVKIISTYRASDVALMEASVDYFIDSDRFNIYYLTLSGHSVYTWANAIASKNRAAVEDLPYGTSVKAYIACQLEFEYALEYLMERLEQAGKLDDTVIVIAPDHYPYWLDNSAPDYYTALKELTGIENVRTDKFNKFLSGLYIYNSAMDRVVIDGPTYSLDILPTLLNLFGLKFDSRLFAGSDVNAQVDDRVVIFKDLSWITAVGRFNAANSKFTPSEGQDPDADYKDYVTRINAMVKDRAKYSKLIQEKDYYTILKNSEDP